MPHGCVNAVGTTISVSEIIGKSLHVVDIGVSGCVDVELSTDWTSAAARFGCIFTSDEYGVAAICSQTLCKKGLRMCSLCSRIQSSFSHGLGRFCVYVSLSGNKGCILSVTVFWNFLIITLESLHEIFQSLKDFLKLTGIHNLPKINRSL